ncbi:MAG: nucleotidyl transferase AbiEii/AbiGii toxin family protein [Rhabdochlamydiaceae bacterium]|nr:nucleotidyl transferase AbiEii/AbiGii toxin family protein [Rhabdochlamydiaceae bacterium]
MIDKYEILKAAKELNIQPTTVEKDYVLGWVLMAIQDHPECQNNWIFKGGTCLKKCFFDNYRFSEDLDFTILPQNHIEESLMKKILKEIGEHVYEQSGIELPEKHISVDLYKNPHGTFSIEGKLTYFGPLKQKTNFPRIKLDLTGHEKIVLLPERREIYHNYSDKPYSSTKAFSYCYEEIFAEKLRALAERARPRDLYDVIHLYQEKTDLLNKSNFLQSLTEKCNFKKIPVPTLEYIERHPQKKTLSSEWENMLRHQLPTLKPFEYFWHQLGDVLNWVHSS